MVQIVNRKAMKNKRASLKAARKSVYELTDLVNVYLNQKQIQDFFKIQISFQ